MPLKLNPTAARPREETKPLVDRRQTNPMFLLPRGGPFP